MKTQTLALAQKEILGDYASSKFHRLLVVVRGTLIVDVAFEKRPTPAGKFFYLSPNLVHRLSAGNDGAEVFEILFDARDWAEVHDRNYLFMKITPAPLTRELSLSLRENHAPALRASLKSALLQLLGRELGAQCAPSQESFKPLEHRLVEGTDERVAKSIRHVLKNSADPDLSVEGLAKKSGLSERQLHRLFEKTLGLSPLEAIHQAKVEKAMDLLRRSEAPITLIAEKAGFSSLTQFNSTFRRIAGQTPSKFRRCPV
jgi:AraC-like DNA-binding protein